MFIYSLCSHGAQISRRELKWQIWLNMSPEWRKLKDSTKNLRWQTTEYISYIFNKHCIVLQLIYEGEKISIMWQWLWRRVNAYANIIINKYNKHLFMYFTEHEHFSGKYAKHCLFVGLTCMVYGHLPYFEWSETFWGVHLHWVLHHVANKYNHKITYRQNSSFLTSCDYTIRGVVLCRF